MEVSDVGPIRHNLESYWISFRSRDSNGLAARGSVPCSVRFFYCAQRADPLWGRPSLLSDGYRGLFPPGIKRPGREADHSPPSSAEVKKGKAIPPLPHTVSWHNA
jgi:hypothetical protein